MHVGYPNGYPSWFGQQPTLDNRYPANFREALR